MVIETERLVLHARFADQRAALYAQIRDPAVMRYLLPVDDDAAFDAMLERMAGWLRDYGYTFWVVERKSDGAALGVCGLKPGAPDTPIADMVEIGWRFGSAHWGKGYAREAAQAVIDWTWTNTHAAEVVAITVQANTASWGLMERLGMTQVAGGEFDHPLVAPDSPLRRHILYRIVRPSHD